MILRNFGPISTSRLARLGKKKKFFELLGVCFLGVSQHVDHFGSKTAGRDSTKFWAYQYLQACKIGQKKKNFFELLGVCFLGVSQHVDHFGSKTAGRDSTKFWAYQYLQACKIGQKKKIFSNFWEYVF